MADVLVVGLGGTGVKTLLHVKKQLLDQRSDGKLPPNVKLLGLDTTTSPDKVKGISGTAAAVRRRVDLAYDGQVDLNLNVDYLYIGGEVHSWVCGNGGDLGWNDAHYARNWFNKRFICDYPGASTLLNIDSGAGQFRQIGRLAFFNALRQGTASNLYRTIQTKLEGLGTNIKLIVCGSLAGGTGASMWLDLAHLITRIASSMNRQVESYAMLALPNSFDWTSPGLVTDSMKARCTAALREMRRFLGVTDQNLGFEMRYSKNDHPVLTARTRGAVYNIVYLFDTRGTPPGKVDPPNPLEVKIEYGIAPTMATWILSLADPVSSPQFETTLANRHEYLVNTLTRDYVTPIVVGSTGIYSVVLPIAALVEEWTISLAQQALEELIPLTSAGLANPAKLGGVSGVEANFTADDWENNPTPIAQDAGKMGISYKPDASGPMIRTVVEREVNDWRAILLPNKPNSDQIEAFDNMIEEKVFFFNEKQDGLFKDPLKGAIVQEESPRNHNNNVETAADELANNCDREEQIKIAEWSNQLNSCMDEQVFAFRRWLREEALKTLNGEEEDIPKNALENRAGKVGWLLKYLSESATHLHNFSRLLGKVIDKRGKTIKPTLRSIDVGERGGKFLEMQKDARKQRDYLKTRQQVLDFRRWELLCKAELDAVNKMYDYAAYFRDNLQAFVTDLSGKRNSVIKDLDNRLEQVRASRKEGMELDRVRELVDDTNWENTQYESYTEHDEKGITAIQRVVASFSWQVEEETIDVLTEHAREVPKLTLQVNGFDIQTNTILDRNTLEISMDEGEPDEIRANRASGNAQRLMARSRMLFDRVWDTLSVVDYLAYKWNGRTTDTAPEAFASYLIEKCDVLLKLPDEGQHMRWLYLLTPEVQNNFEWRNRVYQRLRTDTGAAQGWGGVMDHSDKTTLTYLATVDFVEVEKLDAYKQGLNEYMNLPAQPVGVAGGRSLLHVFHAEERAVDFDYLDVNGQPILVPRRVTAILEEDERFEQYILALALDFIRDETLIKGNNPIGWVKQVEIAHRVGEVDPKTGLEVDKPHVWLLNIANDFVEDQVPYITAAETFCLRLVDYSEPQQKPLDNMRTRLADSIDQEIANLLESKYLPLWEQGAGRTSGVAVYNSPPGDLRDAKLLNEVRKELYADLSRHLQNYQPNIGMRGADESPSLLIQMTKPDEQAFVGLVIRQIGIWLQQ